MLDAVRGADLKLYVTGDYGTLDHALVRGAPPNVRFTGFLDEADYWGLLQSADAIIDLTLMDNCLVCGAYEALALGKPMVLSRNPASLELFDSSAIFTDNTTSDIRGAIERVRREQLVLRVAAERKRDELEHAWGTQAQQLSNVIAEWLSSAGIDPHAGQLS